VTPSGRPPGAARFPYAALQLLAVRGTADQVSRAGEVIKERDQPR